MEFLQRKLKFHKYGANIYNKVDKNIIYKQLFERNH